MDYALVNEAIQEYNSKSTTEIREEIQAITKTYKYGDITTFCNKANITRQTYYELNKNRTARPKFEVYMKVKMVGPSSDPWEKKSRAVKGRRVLNDEDRKRYQHEYYMNVTKVKRAEKRKQKGVEK